jgi:IS5 family transposase
MLVINNSPLLPEFKTQTLELDTTIAYFYEKSQEFIEKYPEIMESIKFDLDSAALNKKKMRNANKEYVESKAIEKGEVLFDPTAYSAPVVDFSLLTGRPRIMNEELVLFFMFVRGLWGSISDQVAAERIKDSISIQVVLSHHGCSTPGINTIRENLNKVSPATRQLILERQAWYIIENELDDFNEMYIDSTAVAANTAFPTDIDILNKLLNRILKSINALGTFGLTVELDSWTITRLNKMEKHLKFVNMNANKGIKGKVKEEYRKFIQLADKVILSLDAAREHLTPMWEASNFNPEKGLALDMIWDKIDQDLWDSAYVLYYANERIEKGVKTRSREKILSVSDRSAGYIQKGQREPVIGYKPQIARSRNGFICGYITPVGNAADSEMLIPTVKHVIATTGIVPELVSTDDGYASKDNIRILHDEIGVLRVSIGGAKGKNLIDDYFWESKEFIEARNQRSAAESGMFTLKFSHSFGRVRRRGIDAVDAELTEKVIAYNFMQIRRKEKQRQIEKEAEELREMFPNAA